jgi:RHS repeat-associated protein
LTVRYVPGPAIDEPVAVVTGNAAPYTHHYFHANRQGSVIAMSDDSGAKVEGPYVYDPYGNCSSGGSACTSTGEPYRFTGRRLDPETGLYYYRARYYWPQGGRFLQTDPVGYTADLNLYTYVENDPVGRTDPTGMDDLINQIRQEIIDEFTFGHVGHTPLVGISRANQRAAIHAAQHPVSTAVHAAVPARGATVTLGGTAAAGTPIGGASFSAGVAVSVAGSQGGQNDVGVFGSAGGALNLEASSNGGVKFMCASLTGDVTVQSGSVNDLRGQSSQFQASVPVTESVPGPTVGISVSSNQAGQVTGGGVSVGAGTGSAGVTSQHTGTCSVMNGCGTHP